MMVTPVIKGWTSKGDGGWMQPVRGVQRTSREDPWSHLADDNETKSVGEVLFKKKQQEKGMVDEDVDVHLGAEGATQSED